MQTATQDNIITIAEAAKLTGKTYWVEVVVTPDHTDHVVTQKAEVKYLANNYPTMRANVKGDDVYLRY